jgi:plastocyanin
MPRRLATLFAISSMCVLAGAGTASAVTIEARDSPLSWSPSTATIKSGESVDLKDAAEGSLPHGVDWTGGPTTPGCSNVPVDSSGTNWSGSCSFAQVGDYPFVCTVHPSMAGTVKVEANGPQPPVVTTESATSITHAGARLNGKIDPNGQSTEYLFEYGTTDEYGLKTDAKDAGSGDSAVAKFEDITGLSPATTYHFRLVATNTTGTTEGADRTFKTLAPATAPDAITDPADSITPVAATLRGRATPNGDATTYFFEYGATAVYGQKTPVKSAGGGATSVNVNAALTGLTPETTYHFRLVAKNGVGEDSGIDRTFTTSKVPVPPLPPPPPPPLEPPTTPVLSAPAPAGPALGSAVKVVAGRKGAPVKGSVEVLPAGAGGRIEVKLVTKGAKGKLVGRTVRSGVPAGTFSFSVPLNAAAKSALKKKKRLSILVQIVFTPASGPPVTVTRSLVLKG